MNNIKDMDELEQYRELGTVDELKSMKENGAFTGVELAQLAAMQMRLKKYESIGTVEELRVARDKQVAIKPDEHNFYEEPHHYLRPDCRNIVGSEQEYCEECGQKLNWEEV